MSVRELTRITIDAGEDGVLNLAAHLPDAINRSGPALAPMPSGPHGYLQSLMDAVRPDDPNAPLEHDDVAVVLTSSGSTGTPRGILLSGQNLIEATHATDARLGGPARWVLAIPTYHVGGFQVLVRAHLSGIPVFPLDSLGSNNSFSPTEFAHTTEAARSVSDADGAPLRVSLVPTQLARILDSGPGASHCLTAYDSILLGGSAAPPGLISRAKALGAKIITTYGMTETTGGCIYDGVPLGGTTIRIAEPDKLGVGRIVLSGPTIAKGYRLLPEDTSQTFVDGELVTSDLGYVNENGRLSVTGRIDDVVQIGGLSVSLSRVELVIDSLDDVSEVVVVSNPHEEWGARVAAFIVVSQESTSSQEGRKIAIAEAVVEELGNEARPRDIVEVESLPMLPSGKVDRVQLKRIAEQHLGS